MSRGRHKGSSVNKEYWKWVGWIVLTYLCVNISMWFLWQVTGINIIQGLLVIIVMILLYIVGALIGIRDQYFEEKNKSLGDS